MIKQKDAICYAMCSATMIREAESHIYGRIPEDHKVLVREIVKEYGLNTGPT